MNARSFRLAHASVMTLPTVSSFMLLIAVGCNPPGHGVSGPKPEDLTAIAAVLNKTGGPLTVIVSDPPATDVLEPDEAIFYEVSQSMVAREFEFQSGESVATESLRLLIAGENPGFATGLLTVSFSDDNETLAVERSIERASVFALHRKAIAPASSVFLMVNANPFKILVVAPTGSGVARDQNRHTAMILDEGGTLEVNISPADPGDALELTHVLEAPPSESGQVSAFIAFVTLHETELAVETQNAAFRRLE